MVRYVSEKKIIALFQNKPVSILMPKIDSGKLLIKHFHLTMKV